MTNTMQLAKSSAGFDIYRSLFLSEPVDQIMVTILNTWYVLGHRDIKLENTNVLHFT